MGATKQTVLIAQLVCCVGILSVSSIGGGCQNMRTNGPHLCQVVVGNRAERNVLRSVEGKGSGSMKGG